MLALLQVVAMNKTNEGKVCSTAVDAKQEPAATVCNFTATEALLCSAAVSVAAEGDRKAKKK
jgi:hypothetical protein